MPTLKEQVYQLLRRGYTWREIQAKTKAKIGSIRVYIDRARQEGHISKEEYQRASRGIPRQRARARASSPSPAPQGEEHTHTEPGRGYRIGEATVPALIFDNVEALGGRAAILPLTEARLLVKLYSDMGASCQMRELADFFGMDIAVFQAIKQRLGLTHRSPDVIDEELSQLALGEIFQRAEKSLAEKRLVYRIARAIKERQELRRELEELRKRHDMTEEILQSLRDAIQALPKQTLPVPDPSQSFVVRTERVHMMNFFDWQVGLAFASEASAVRPYNAEVFRRRLGMILTQWERYAARDAAGVCYVIFGGDQLHGPLGRTGHGTPLPAMNPSGTEQILFTKQAIEQCLQVASRNYPHVIAVFIGGGNHDKDELLALDFLYLIGEILRAQYEGERVRFITTRASSTKLTLSNDIEVLIDHGYSLPQPAVERMSGLKLVPAERLAQLMGMSARYKYVVRGDKHTRGYREHTSVEEVAVGSLVGGDPYSEAKLQAASRPSQTLLIFEKERGWVEHVFLYAD
ncbi:MAG: hypothetical protein QXE50_08080 [Nitrososphaerota archaeon]